LRRRAVPGRPEVLDVHVGPDSRLPGGLQVGPPVTDDVAGPVAEAGCVRVAAQLPAEHRLVKGGRPGHVPGRDGQVRHPARPGYRALDARIVRLVLLRHGYSSGKLDMAVP